MSAAKHTRIIDCDRAAYDDMTAAVNWSTLKYACTSALAYQHALETPREDTDAMRLGRLVHTAVFEPESLDTEYITWTGGIRRGGEWEAFKAAHARLTIIKPEDLEAALRISFAVRSHKVAGRLLAKGQAESTVTWRDADTGIRCKARLDWITSRYLVDLKTSRDIDARAFGRTAGQMLYHGQLAFYQMGLEANGLKRKAKIIAVENEAPYDVAVYGLSDDMLWAGECRAKEALVLVARCRRSHVWPGRYPKEQPLMLPQWEYPKDDDNEFSLADLGLVPAGMGAGGR